MTSSGAEALPARIVLDTSAYSRAQRGDALALDAIARAEVVFLPVTVLGELEAGFRVGSRYRENRRALDEFLREPCVQVLDVTGDVARLYGQVFASLRRAGTPLPVNDIWIAATTLGCGAHLVTFDEDFARIDGLPHTLYPARRG
ncbi:MAG: type II toxin-antitoxin system VapC family toxin [Acidobacteria bacterium]|nr:type II toxin-antitoxin system VapC family toxin [Acidobacteriota bacterium]